MGAAHDLEPLGKIAPLPRGWRVTSGCSGRRVRMLLTHAAAAYTAGHGRGRGGAAEPQAVRHGLYH